MDDYLELLEHSYTVMTVMECPPTSRCEFLSEYIFEFVTYDSEIADLFGRKAVEICVAINNRKTFEYQSTEDGYKWFLVMCNMPFFITKIDWGTSIRGAYWDEPIELKSCGLWDGDEQMTDPIYFNKERWAAFVHAMEEFVSTK